MHKEEADKPGAYANFEIMHTSDLNTFMKSMYSIFVQERRGIYDIESLQKIPKVKG